MSTKLREFIRKAVNYSDASSRLEKISGMDAADRMHELQNWALELGIGLCDYDFEVVHEEGELSLDEIEDVSGGKADLYNSFKSVIDDLCHGMKM